VVRASLADQGSSGGPDAMSQLAIGLGANLPSAAGGPIDTLVAVRPLLEQLLQSWAPQTCWLRWSPLFRTAPVGGPPGQPDYLNAAVVAEVALAPTPLAALDLLVRLQQLERAFGRERLEHWGPRTLDLDLLWWGDLQCDLPALQLPHPRWHQRHFVLAPLLAIERSSDSPLRVPARFALLSGLRPDPQEPLPQPLSPEPLGWPA
jgi:2-amino-4-hydroxy-6-hydroxymethyldihydropteridine diphosphokinase